MEVIIITIACVSAWSFLLWLSIRSDRRMSKGKKKLFAVEYAGFITIQDSPEYGGKDMLNADNHEYNEHAGKGSEISALALGQDLVNAYNEKYKL